MSSPSFTALGFAPMFKLLEPQDGSVSIEIDGERISVPPAISVAAALWLHGSIPSRLSVVGHAPRAPYCMMGVCFECRVEIDGDAERQACMVTVAEGMRIRQPRDGAAQP